MNLPEAVAYTVGAANRPLAGSRRRDPMRPLVTIYREAYAGLSRDVWLLALVTLVNRAGTMVLPFLTLYLTQHLGFTASRAGIVVALFGVGSMAGSWLGGRLSDAIDPNRVQALSLVGMAAGFVVLTRLDEFLPIAVAVVVLATIGEAFRPALFVAVARSARPANRARSFALIRLAINVGMAIAPAAGGLLAVRNYHLLFWVDAATCVAAAVLVFSVIGPCPAPIATSTAGSPRGARGPWTDLPFIAFLVLVFTLAGAFFQLFSTFPLHLRELYGWRESSIGGLLAVHAGLVALVEMPLVRSVEHRDPLRVAALGALLVCTGLAVVPLGPPGWVAVLSMLLWTFGEMLALPMSNAVVAERADGAATGRYMGAYTLSFSAALVVAPALGTAVWEHLSPATLWVAIGVLGPLLAVGFAAVSRRFARGA